MANQVRALLKIAGLGLVMMVLLGQSFPRDDTGVPAPVAVFVGSGGAMTRVTIDDRLPVSTVAGTTSSTDPTGFGKRYFQSSGDPGAGATVNGAALLLDETSAILFACATGTTLRTFNSIDGGQSWTRGGDQTLLAGECSNNVRGVIRPPGAFVIVVDASGAVSGEAVKRSTTGLQFTDITLPSIGLQQDGKAIAIQGSTVLVAVSVGATHFICRSIDSGQSFSSCTDHAGPGTWDDQASLTIASPALNIWLVLDSVGSVFRSSDDGVSFGASPVLTMSNAGTIAGGIECLTSTVCLAVDNVSEDIWRSADAGLTWAVTFTAGQTANFGGFVDFGSGVVNALTTSTPNGDIYRSTDTGQTFQLVTTFTPIASVYRGDSVFGGRAIVLGGSSGQAYYSPVVAPGTVVLSGENGVAVAINSGGELGVFQGVGTLDPTSRWLVQLSDTVQTQTLRGANLAATKTDVSAVVALSPNSPLPPVQINDNTNLFNSETTGANNTAVVTTIAVGSNRRAHLYAVDARCSAGTSGITVDDGATTIWTTTAAEVTTTRLRETWPVGLTGTATTVMTITLATCGAGNAGTLTVQADRF